jgi:hypothetical protein
MPAGLRERNQGLHSDSRDDVAQELGKLCDFCGDRVSMVRRVALDQEYDRLQKVHQEQYSCSTCFEAKEQKRLGLARR